jgi:hypothetical protein
MEYGKAHGIGTRGTDKQMILMRGYIGEVIFHFDLQGHATGLELTREWIGPTLQCGVEYRLLTAPLRSAQ